MENKYDFWGLVLTLCCLLPLQTAWGIYTEVEETVTRPDGTVTQKITGGYEFENEAEKESEDRQKEFLCNFAKGLGIKGVRAYAQYIKAERELDYNFKKECLLEELASDAYSNVSGQLAQHSYQASDEVTSTSKAADWGEEWRQQKDKAKRELKRLESAKTQQSH